MRVVIVGHVDHGKSTLVGRLMHDTGSLPEGKLEQLHRSAASRGAPFEWANVMDALQSERDQNITIDAAQIWFRTPRREYVLIDTPGHEEFLKNMVTGASGADAALLLIDAREGVCENTRRHGYLLGLLGIREVVVIVNKMDLVQFDEARFRQIEAEYFTWLQSVGVSPRAFVPVAARHGDNIASAGENMPWYGGPTLLHALDAMKTPPRLLGRPLRFPVQDVYRFDDRRILAGRIESGTLHVGDRLVFSPSGKTSVVRSIERWSAPVTDEAHEGECVGITLTEQVFVERGCIAARESARPKEHTAIPARIFWLGTRPLHPGRVYKLKLATTEAECEIATVDNVIDASTLVSVEGKPSDGAVPRHAVADVTLRVRKPIAFDAFDDVAGTGRFVIVDGYDVAGGGIVLADPHGPLVSAAPNGRRQSERNGHGGLVFWLSGPAGSGKSPVAAELERELISRGHRFVEVRVDDRLPVAESVSKILDDLADASLVESRYRGSRGIASGRVR